MNPMPGLYGTRDPTQGFVCAKQAHYLPWVLPQQLYNTFIFMHFLNCYHRLCMMGRGMMQVEIGGQVALSFQPCE